MTNERLILEGLDLLLRLQWFPADPAEADQHNNRVKERLIRWHAEIKQILSDVK